jgi:hypothetical protein
MVFRASEISTTVNEANAPEAAGVSTSADLKSKILRLFRKWLVLKI